MQTNDNPSSFGTELETRLETLTRVLTITMKPQTQHTVLSLDLHASTNDHPGSFGTEGEAP